MSSNRPRNTSAKGPGSGKPGAGGPRRPNPPGGATRPSAGPVRVNPTRPQNRPAGTPPPRNLPALLIGGGAVLVAVILLGTIFLNQPPTPAVAPTATAPALSGNSGGPAPAVTSGGPAPAVTSGGPAPAGSVALVETPKGSFKIRLFTDDSSVKGTVKNFVDKVNAGYFNGKIFHRVENWVIQGGDPLGNGTGGGSIPGEYNARPFKRGAVGMASTGAHGPTVNDSQWFVVKTDADYLDNSYSNFGQVTDGMDVVDKIAIGDTMTKITMQP